MKHQESNSLMDINKVIAKMQEGMTMTRFYPSGKRKPENRRYYVNLERMMFYWSRPDRPVEGSGKYTFKFLIGSKSDNMEFNK